MSEESISFEVSLGRYGGFDGALELSLSPKLAKLCEQYGVTGLTCVPPLWLQLADSRIVSAALPPQSPSFPNRTLIMGAVGLLAVAVGVASLMAPLLIAIGILPATRRNLDGLRHGHADYNANTLGSVHS